MSHPIVSPHTPEANHLHSTLQACRTSLEAIDRTPWGNDIAQQMLHAHKTFLDGHTDFVITQRKLQEEIRLFVSLASLFEGLSLEEIENHSKQVETFNTLSSTEAKAFALASSGNTKKKISPQELRTLQHNIQAITKLLHPSIREKCTYQDMHEQLQAHLTTLLAKKESTVFYAFLHFHDDNHQGVKAKLESLISFFAQLQTYVEKKNALSPLYASLHAHIQTTLAKKSEEKNEYHNKNQKAQAVPKLPITQQWERIQRILDTRPDVQKLVLTHLHILTPDITLENASATLSYIEQQGDETTLRTLYTVLVDIQNIVGDTDLSGEAIGLVNSTVNQRNIERLENEIQTLTGLASQLLSEHAYQDMIESYFSQYTTTPQKTSLVKRIARSLQEVCEEITHETLTTISSKTKKQLSYLLLLLASIGGAKYYIDDPHGVFEGLQIAPDDIKNTYAYLGGAYEMPQDIGDTLHLDAMPDLHYWTRHLDPEITDGTTRERIACELTADGNKIFSIPEARNYDGILINKEYRVMYESAIATPLITQKGKFILFLYFYAQENLNLSTDSDPQVAHYTDALQINEDINRLPIDFSDTKYDHPFLLRIALQLLINENDLENETHIIRLQNITTPEQKALVTKYLIQEYASISKALHRLAGLPSTTAYTKTQLAKIGITPQ